VIMGEVVVVFSRKVFTRRSRTPHAKAFSFFMELR